jgi:hypothetical protein
LGGFLYVISKPKLGALEFYFFDSEGSQLYLTAKTTAKRDH